MVTTLTFFAPARKNLQDCSAETVDVAHLNNGVGEPISHIRVRTPDHAGLVSMVGSISKSW
jgi:hypothetical protein